MKVIIAGDFAPRARLAKQIKDKRFSEVFPENLRAIIKSADFSFVNFESPIVEDAYQPISKCGPNLRCTPEAAEAVKYAGFTGVTMANNHILDYGFDGLHKSVKCCKSQGLDIVGVGDNLADAEKVLYLNKEGKCLAVINCCEHEFSIATENEAGANPLNPVRQFYAIQEAKKNADYVLVIVHGGHEHFQLPSPRMQETYRFFVDAGADAVVNHHQHCLSGYEVYNGKPIFYGLGNFAFDLSSQKEETFWNRGFMVELSFGDSIGLKIYPYRQYAETPSVELLPVDAYRKELVQLNDIIGNQTELLKAVSCYYQRCSKYELSTFEPYSGRIFSKLLSMGLLPRFLTKKKALMIRNHVECQSHRDKLIYAIKQK